MGILKDNKVKTRYMFNKVQQQIAQQTDFVINYIDPESNTVRSYYPDFLVQKEDGSYIIIEVKGEHMIDSAVVQAKKEYAKQIASASSMDYIIVPGKMAKERIPL